VPRPQTVLRRLYQAAFGQQPSSVITLEGDGSARKMFRLVGPDLHTAIGVMGPDREENRAFLSFTHAFRGAGLPVPEVYAADEEAGIYLEQDLGDTTLFERLEAMRAEHPGERFPEPAAALYRRVLEILPRFQIEGGRVVDYSVAYPRAAFDRQSILWDLNYFKYHFLKLAHIPFNEARLEADFRRLTAFLLRADQRHFLYRDFQSRNIMVPEGEPWFIDYQGGRRGALQYDVASFLYDAKAEVPPEQREALLEHYLEALSGLLPLDRDLFRQQYTGYVLVRILQAMGAYGYRGFFERKPRFLQSVPPAIDNLERMLGEGFLPVQLPELRATLERIVAAEPLRRRSGPVPAGLTLQVGSFAYKHGYPEDGTGHGGGFVFDCRALHNPGRYAEFADLCGRDETVVRFLEEVPEAGAFWESVTTLVDGAVESYRKRGFQSLSVHFGCTGGQHRSVYFAERLAAHLRERHPGVHVLVKHREERSWPANQAADADAAEAAEAAEAEAGG
jgi:aminoglycoside/choline kinase family phosphotransferase